MSDTKILTRESRAGDDMASGDSMIDRRLKILGFAAVALAVSCSEGPDLGGTWELWSIDGVPPSEAYPERFEVFEALWWDTQVLSSDLVFLQEGDVEETRISVSTRGIPAETYRLMGGHPPEGEDVVQVSQPPETRTILRSWRANGGSVVLFTTPEQRSNVLAASYRKAFPEWSEARLRAQVDSLFGDEEGAVEEPGVIEGDRLTIQDKNGRILVYRRTEAAFGR